MKNNILRPKIVEEAHRAVVGSWGQLSQQEVTDLESFVQTGYLIKKQDMAYNFGKDLYMSNPEYKE